MKRILALSAALTLLAVFLPLAFAGAPAAAKAKPSETQSAAFQPKADAAVQVTLAAGDGNRTMNMHDYIVGVVAAEMPAKFEPEALKAQAVAARTYAMRDILGAGKHADTGADLCSDPACCQAWISEDQMRNNWGENYATNAEKISSAVSATDGQYLVSGGAPILAAFHSSSGGQTESSARAWGRDEPYLVSVTSPETENDVPNFVTTMTAGKLDFRDTVLSAHPEANFTGAPETWVGKITDDASGRVSTAEVGGVELTGGELRGLFSLRSTEFSIDYDQGAFTFTVTGSGHGVGMSQYGAETMALDGSGYAEILEHYYPGAALIAVKK